MNIADPKYLEQLRDLPSGYLLDLIADNAEMDKESVYWVLRERGMTREEFDQKLQRRQNSSWPRPYTLWAFARWLTLFNALIVTYFNTSNLYQLLHSDHPFKGPLLFLSIGCILCGFMVGFKLTTHLYQGDRSILYCGFPIPVGFVDLESGDEIPFSKARMIMRMALNALVGVNLTLFPLTFIYVMID